MSYQIHPPTSRSLGRSKDPRSLRVRVASSTQQLLQWEGAAQPRLTRDFTRTRWSTKRLFSFPTFFLCLLLSAPRKDRISWEGGVIVFGGRLAQSQLRDVAFLGVSF